MDPVRVSRTLWNTLLTLLFPPRCAGCGRHGAVMCPDCLAQVRFLPTGGRPPGRKPDSRPQALDGLLSAVAFAGPARAAIHQLKYRGRQELAPLLAGWMAARWQAQPAPIDAVAAVPLHSRRERRRGYNQSALLARELCGKLDAQMLSGELLRVRETPPQVGLSASQRLENVRGAFSCPSQLSVGMRILLVDDVATTGATLGACAQALRSAGCASVWGLTVARVTDEDDRT